MIMGKTYTFKGSNSDMEIFASLLIGSYIKGTDLLKDNKFGNEYSR